MLEDPLRTLQDAARSVVAWLAGLTGADVRRYLLLGAVVLLSYLLMRWLIRRLLPWLLARLLLPVTGAIVVVAGAALLTVQAVLAVPFRIATLRPPAVVFAAGDLVGAAMLRLRAGLRLLALRTYVIRKTPPIVVMVVLAATAWWGHDAGCRRDPGADMCHDPVAAVIERADGMWQRAVRTLQRPAVAQPSPATAAPSPTPRPRSRP
jgi:hypothetical protein